jgi:hypothetical protein
LVKIVVDIDARALRACFDARMFVCFVDCFELKRAALPLSVPTYSRWREFRIPMFQNGSNKYSGAACRIKEEFCCSGDLQAFPAAASGKHPRPRFG